MNEKKERLAREINKQGIILKREGLIKKAINLFKEACELDSHFEGVLLNLANAYFDLEELDLAIIYYKKAIKLKADYALAYYNLGIIYSLRREYLKAIRSQENAIKILPNFSLSLAELLYCKSCICEWSGEKEKLKFLSQIEASKTAVAPLSLMTLDDNPAKHLIRAKRYYKQEYKTSQDILYPNKKERIHIGYFSGHFYEHATMHLLGKLFELHNKEKFKVHAYSFGPNKIDKYTNIVRNNVDIFRDIRRMSDKDCKEIARYDNLDIAIDLMGYALHNRMNIFSTKVAPIQISYLGYPGTSGSDCIDYIIADKIVIPEKYTSLYTEEIIYMPNSYQCNDTSRINNIEPLRKVDFGIPRNSFVFVCFNASNKINKEEFDVWMNILKEVKDSILWLLCSNKRLCENLQAESTRRGIDPKRIIFAKQLPIEKHIARYKCADLFLDTFNYNAHTTASDALLAGLPLITKVGESFSARVGASLLTALDLPELITGSTSQYEKLAITLGSDKILLTKYRDKLKKNITSKSLFNIYAFTKNLEDKYILLYNNLFNKA